MSGGRGLTRMCLQFLFLMIALVLSTSLVGCEGGGKDSAKGELTLGGEDPWPLGDGSSWYNVMEAGFNPPEPAPVALLAGHTSPHVHFHDRVSQGPLCLFNFGFGLPCRLTSVAQSERTAGSAGPQGKAPVMADLVFPAGKNRLLQAGLKSGRGAHIALSDRFWNRNQPRRSSGELGSRGSFRVNSRFIKGAQGRGRLQSRGNIPGHFWIYY